MIDCVGLNFVGNKNNLYLLLNLIMGNDWNNCLESLIFSGYLIFGDNVL